MMTVLLTCPGCGSGVHVYPHREAQKAQCEVCQREIPLTFTEDHEKGEVRVCPCCGKRDFFIQKDFNRKIGVTLFVLCSILAIFTYGLSFLVLYALDFWLFRKLKYIVICYSCQAIFRNANNQAEITEFNHEMNDRIVYAGHDFHGKPLPPK